MFLLERELLYRFLLVLVRDLLPGRPVLGRFLLGSLLGRDLSLLHKRVVLLGRGFLLGTDLSLLVGRV